MMRGKAEVWTLVWASRSKAGCRYAWAVNRGCEADGAVDNLEIGHAKWKREAEEQARAAAAKWREKLLGRGGRRRKRRGGARGEGA